MTTGYAMLALVRPKIERPTERRPMADVNLQSLNWPGPFVRHGNFRGMLTQRQGPIDEGTEIHPVDG